MNPNREELLFQLALSKPAEKRAAWLDAECEGDPALRQRLDALLAAHEQPDPLLAKQAETARPTIKLDFADEPADEAVGQTLGRYKLLEKIGEGGCGVVYVAEQTEPVRRRVALKVIKLGMDTKAVVARFEAERQALAMMDHPNIAKVLDAGTTDVGRPYFVMELVRGIKITDYCDQARLSTKERIGLFINVCHAIQHAHQKGIIHRHIKPSNILVTLHDGVPVPKVIDFGIAKATEGRLTDATVYTQLHQFIGTPAYMSPEQAEMSGLDIDTRSDIYSLGVLLYELLAGSTPFDANELAASGIDAMRKTIREKEPVRPSTKLAALHGEDLTSTANRRSTDTQKLFHLVKGDLDWIVMKCLEKDRTRRYETATGLAQDIQRYLKQEPIMARPPGSLYRFQKLVRRNKTVFAAIGAVAVTLITGFGLSLYLFIQERQARQRAVAAETEQIRLRKEAEAGRALEARRAEMGEKLSQAGMMMGRAQFKEAEDLISKLPPHPSSASILNVLGAIYGRTGNWPAAARNMAKVVEFVPTDHLAHHYLAPLLIQIGDLEGYRRLCDRILHQFGETPDPTVSERMAKDCLILPPPAKDLPTIVKMADRAVAAGPGHRNWDYFQFVKGLAEYRQGRPASAVEWLQNVVSHDGDATRTVEAYLVMAMAQFQLKRTDEARVTLAKGFQIADAKLKAIDSDSPNDLWNDWLIAHILMREARALIEAGTNPTAIP